jgi:O-antigen/teichoic acid export membrane protein
MYSSSSTSGRRQPRGRTADAKTLVAVLVLAASAISTSIRPKAARYARDRFRSFLLRAVALTAAVVIPSLVVFVLLGHLIVAVTFGSSYEAAVAPLPWLAVGMSAMRFYL